MSFEEALLSVVPGTDSWKRTCAIAEELRTMQIDEPKPEVIEPHTIHPILSSLAMRGVVKCQPAMRTLLDAHSGFEYQRPS